MIAKLTGIIDEMGEDYLIIDVGGVGYLVYCVQSILHRQDLPGSSLSLYIETVMREDAIRLFGFATPDERNWFRILTAVQGVGPRVALAILGILPPYLLSQAILMQDSSALLAAPGVGKRLAARLVGELKERNLPAAGPVPTGQAAKEGDVLTAVPGANAALNSSAEDAILALVNLGYARTQSAAVIGRIMSTGIEDESASALIRKALKELAL